MSDIVDGTTSKTTSRGLMLPPQERPLKRKREQKVLDEDEWTDKLEAIIQRDYFPDIPKLENELEWLEVSDGSPEESRLHWDGPNLPANFHS